MKLLLSLCVISLLFVFSLHLNEGECGRPIRLGRPPLFEHTLEK